ncbi:hypothetical protein ACE6H2_002706 [Prunus campanulata]
MGFSSRVACKSLGTRSSSIDEYLKLRWVLDLVAIEEEGKGRKHAKSDHFYGSCDASRARMIAFDSGGGDWG